MGNVCGRRNKDGAVSNGGLEPPPEDEGFFLGNGDIIITTFPKCGTTWMQYIVLTLLYKGDASKIKNMDIQSPFLEDMAKGKGKDKEDGGHFDDWEFNPVHKGKGKGGDLWDESMMEKDGWGKGKEGKDKDKDKDKGKDKGKDKDKDGKGKDKKGKDKKGKDKKGKGKDKDPEEEKMLRELVAWDDSNWFEGRPKPSVFKTHRMPDSVLWEGGVKEIARCKCIVVTRNPKDAMISLYRQEHDNSPPTFIGPLSDWVELFTSAFKARGGERLGCFWKWHAEWSQIKTTYPDNVLWISFEDMKKDNPAQVRKVAAFLGIEASEELVQQCVEAAKFSNMKEKAGDQVSSLLRQGTSGGWRAELKGKALEHFDKIHKEKMEEYAIPFEFDFGAEG